jgi:hypothetical protein
MVASGTGAPPHNSMRRLDRSASGHRGCAAIASYTAGTPNSEVTRWLSIASRVRPGSNPGSMSTAPPLSRVGRQSMLSAAVWNSGATTSAISSCLKSASTTTLSAFQVTLPWLSVAPLDPPVVPEVYMIRHGSSRLTGSSRSMPGTAASRPA